MLHDCRMWVFPLSSLFPSERSKRGTSGTVWIATGDQTLYQLSYSASQVVPEKGPLNGCVCVWMISVCLCTGKSSIYTIIQQDCPFDAVLDWHGCQEASSADGRWCGRDLWWAGRRSREERQRRRQWRGCVGRQNDHGTARLWLKLT